VLNNPVGWVAEGGSPWKGASLEGTIGSNPIQKLFYLESSIHGDKQTWNLCLPSGRGFDSFILRWGSV